MKPILREQKVWLGEYRKVEFKIVNWSFDSPTPDLPSGNWNYYLYLRETAMKDFPALWLPRKVKESPGGYKYVTYDYFKGPVGRIEMHGGVTYYEKGGDVKGFRYVEVGCDYQHLCDARRSYDVATVLDDVIQSIDWLYENGYMKESL